MTVRLIQGNALAIPLADKSVHCCVTSPPYWGLRDYGVEGQLGLEPTFDEYLANMLKVFAEVHRVLRDDGTLWLNMGDGYAGSWGAQSREHAGKHAPNVSALSANQVKAAAIRDSGTGSMARTPGLKAKDLIGQPWALAFALRAAGWYLRSDIIWAKPAPMPESVSDRPTKSHEYLFLLTKREKYFFDQAAWLEPLAAPKEAERGTPARFGGTDKHVEGQKQSRLHSGNEYHGTPSGKRNRRTVWTVGSQPTREAHFATFPEALVEPCLLAGCPSKCCPTCGTGWEPIEEKTRTFESGSGKAGNMPAGKNGEAMQGGGETMDVRRGPTLMRETTGYAPGCSCPNPEPEPGTAFDPFSGSGTVCAVANRMGYNGIGLELNPKYIEIAMRRIFADVVPTPEEKAKGQRLAFT